MTPTKESPVTTEFPTIRATIEALKPLAPEGFLLIVQYSGSNDSGWFDYEFLQTKDGKEIYPVPDGVRDILDSNCKAIYEELHPLLYNRFPGWEIGDGHVNGSHGHFTINSATNTITQTHILDFNEEEDLSPDEEVKF